MTDPRLRRAAWARSIFLGIASIACLIMGGSIAGRSFPRTQSAMVIVDLLGGPWAFALPFLAAGLAGIVVTVAGWRAPGLVLCMGALFGFWGLLYLGLWIAGIQPGGYITATWLILIDVLLFGLTLLPARRS